MIAQLTGRVSEKSENNIIVDVSGVGYLVGLSQLDLDRCQLEQDIKLAIHMAVRENSIDLYGFIEPESKQLFGQLISVSGVGPKVGLSILGLGEAKSIKAAIASENSAYVSGATGVGKRLADKIIVELRQKLAAYASESSGGYATQTGDDAHAGLLVLGYSSSQATQALAGKEGSVEERIKAALKELS